MSRKKTVLLCDDDTDFLAMNRAVLEKNGYDVITAHCGALCEDRAKAMKPDLVVLDIAMHGIGDGLFVAHALRRDPTTKDIPILVASCLNQLLPGVVGKGRDYLPGEGFLGKPVAPKTLLEEVDRMIGRRTLPP